MLSETIAFLTAISWTAYATYKLDILSIPLFLLASVLLNVRYYVVTDRQKKQAILRRITWGTHLHGTVSGRMEYRGYFRYGWRAFGYTTPTPCRNDDDLVLLCTASLWEELTAGSLTLCTSEPPPPSPPGEQSTTTTENNTTGSMTMTRADAEHPVKAREHKACYVTTYGSYEYTHYQAIRISLTHSEPYQHQEKILRAIVKTFEEKKHCSVFIHGPMGSGKSYLLYLLVSYFSSLPQKPSGEIVAFANSIWPWLPSINLDSIHRYIPAEPSSTAPLILSFDEIDVALANFSSGKSITNIKYPIQVRDKSSWNLFLDNFSHGLLPFTILLFTSNRSPDDIASNVLNGDQSFLRQGRIDLVCELMDPKKSE
jgi:hypothetical protein